MITESTGHGSTGTTTIWENYGHWLREKRREAGLTQRALAQKAGVSYQNVSRYEHGQLPTLANHLKLQETLDEIVINVGFEPRQP